MTSIADVEELINSDVERFSAFVWGSYVSYGRGFLMVNLTGAVPGLTAQSILVESLYRTVNDMIEGGFAWPSEDFRVMVESYNPQVEFVVVAKVDDGQIGLVMNPEVPPPEAYGRHGGKAGLQSE